MTAANRRNARQPLSDADIGDMSNWNAQNYNLTDKDLDAIVWVAVSV